MKKKYKFCVIGKDEGKSINLREDKAFLKSVYFS